MWLPDVAAVKGVAAFRAKLRGMLWIFRLPAHLSQRYRVPRWAWACRTRCRICPGSLCRSCKSSRWAGVCRILCRHFPEFCAPQEQDQEGVEAGSEAWGRAPHLVQLLGIHTAGGRGHVEAHKAQHGAAFIFGGGLHGLALGANQVAAAMVGSRMTAVRCSSLIMASSSGEALAELMPKEETVSPPEVFFHF